MLAGRDVCVVAKQATPRGGTRSALINGRIPNPRQTETEKPVAPLSITAGIDKKPAPSHEPYSSLGGSTDGYPSKGVAAVAVDMEVRPAAP